MRKSGLMSACLMVVAALATAAPGAADPVHARATKYDNVHIRVADPARAGAWYVKNLGARADSSPTRVYFGDTLIAIVKTDKPQPSAGSVIDHIALSYADLDARLKILGDAGITVTPSPRGHAGFAKSAFIEDPWGVRIELVQDSEATGFHHVHLKVPDPQAALTWYHEMLGASRGKVKGNDGVRFGNVWLLAEKGAGAVPSADRAIQNVALQVTEIQKAVTELKGKGVQVVTEPRAIGPLWYAFVEGPNGVRTELLQRP
jgi:catechol 2,3-dioxygenase-like lactoylglutathione lyase family enzyme